MTTTDWIRIKPSLMHLGYLVPTHEVKHPLDGPDTSHCGDRYPHVIYWHGKFRISDGHHRIARRIRDGFKMMFVRIAVPTVHFNRA